MRRPYYLEQFLYGERGDPKYSMSLVSIRRSFFIFLDMSQLSQFYDIYILLYRGEWKQYFCTVVKNIEPTYTFFDSKACFVK
jgi:hypothetical protein